MLDQLLIDGEVDRYALAAAMGTTSIATLYDTLFPTEGARAVTHLLGAVSTMSGAEHDRKHAELAEFCRGLPKLEEAA